MRRSPTRTFPVTVSRLPLVRCELCGQTIAHRQGKAGVVLTEHYIRAHPEVLRVPPSGSHRRSRLS
jgi:hypothetical protein